MKVIQISDLHFVPDGEHLHGIDPKLRLRSCISDVNRIAGDADLCVLTGDLADRGEVAAYQSLASELSALHMPYIVMAGNHDIRENLLDVFKDAHRDENGFVQGQYLSDVATLLFLDTLEPGTHSGVYCDKRLEWLEAQLAQNKQRDVYLFMHHPPFDIGIPALDRIRLRESLDLQDTLARAENIRHIFFGHVHRPVSGSYNGIPFSSLPGTNHQVTLDFKTADFLSYSHERPAFAIIELAPEHTIVHLQDFSDTGPRRQPDGRWIPAFK